MSGASGSSISESIDAKSIAGGAGSGSGAGGDAVRAEGKIWAGDKVRGSGAGFVAAGGAGTARGMGGGAIAAAGAATGGAAGLGAGAGAVDASSSAMICRMDERISSIDGSLVAGLFIETPLYRTEWRTHRKMRLIRHGIL